MCVCGVFSLLFMPSVCPIQCWLSRSVHRFQWQMKMTVETLSWLSFWMFSHERHREREISFSCISIYFYQYSIGLASLSIDYGRIREEKKRARRNSNESSIIRYIIVRRLRAHRVNRWISCWTTTSGWLALSFRNPNSQCNRFILLYKSKLWTSAWEGRKRTRAQIDWTSHRK